LVYSQNIEYETVVDDEDIQINTYDIEAVPVQVVSGKENFDAAATTASMDTCTLDTKENPIKVANTGNMFSEYIVTLKGSAAKYVTAVPDRFSLMPGKSTKIINYIHFPSGADGEYDLKVNIRTRKGLEKEIVQKIDSKLCNNNVLLAYNFNQTACPCLPMVYEFGIKNAGNYVEAYGFGLDKFAEYANVSANPLILTPGEEKNIKLYLNLDCSIYGDNIVHFYSTAQSSGIKSKVPLLLNINPCYDYEIKTGKLLDNNDAKFDVSFVSNSAEYTVCGGDAKSIQIRLDNGYIGNNYFYSVDGPSWGSVYGNVLRLNGYDSGYAYLDLNPKDELTGEYKFTLNFESQLGKEKKQKVVTVNVEDCYNIAVDIPIEEKVCGCEYSEVEFDVFNYGRYTEKILLEVEGPDFVNLSKSEVEIMTGESEKVKAKISSDCSEKSKSEVRVNKIRTFDL
jgi:hypothetical protein